MTVRINKEKINLREKLAEFEDKVNFDEVIRGLGENTSSLILNKDGGNVGIGTTGTGSGRLYVIGGNHYNEGITLAGRKNDGSTLTTLRFFHDDDNYAHIARGSSECISISSNGNVGIGTTDPSGLLTVNGDIFINPADQTATTNGGVLRLATSSTNAFIASNQWYDSSTQELKFTIDGYSQSINMRPHTGKIEFRTTANSGTENTEVTPGIRMTIDPDGNVGIGTTAPGTNKLDVQGVLSVGSTAASTSVGYINVQGYRGTSDQGLLGHVKFDNQNGDNTVGKIEVYAAGSANTGTMRFHTSGSEKMRITSGGNVGIGTTSPTSIVSASVATNAFAFVQNVGYGTFTSNSSGPGLYINKTNSTTSESTDYINFRNKGTKVGGIEYDGVDVQLVQTSDARLKENIQDSGSGLNLVNNLKVRSFDWVEEKRQGKKFGFVAQEMHEVFEDAVKIGGEDVNESPWGVFDSKLIPVFAKAIQEQQAIIEDLKSRIETLESK